MEVKEMSFPAAMKDYFGARPGTKGTAGEFMLELKALSDDDKNFFREALPSVGYKLK